MILPFPFATDEYNLAWYQLKSQCPSLSGGDFETYYKCPQNWTTWGTSPLEKYPEFAGNPDPLGIGKAYQTPGWVKGMQQK
jgi:hypothetical protein